VKITVAGRRGGQRRRGCGRRAAWGVGGARGRGLWSGRWPKAAGDGEAPATKEADGATALQGFLAADDGSRMRRPKEVAVVDDVVAQGRQLVAVGSGATRRRLWWGKQRARWERGRALKEEKGTLASSRGSAWG
jgi:hypothetical protein